MAEDHLGKFNGKADEGFFVGYSVNSKAFIVFNSRTRIVEETLHITFLENKPSVAGSRPECLFDIDTLTKSMNYKPVIAGNQTNTNASTKESIDVGQAGKKTVPSHEYILLPLWTPDSPISSSPKRSDDDVANDAGKKYTKDPTNEGDKDDQDLRDEFEREFERTKDADDEPMMPNLEEIVYTDDDEDVGAETDMTNLDTHIPISLILTTRIHKDHPVEQIIGDIHSTPQTRRMTKSVTDHVEPKKVIQALTDPSWIEAIRLFLAYALFKDFVVYQMDVNRFEDPEFPDRVYKVEKALYGLHQAPRAWVEDSSFPNIVYKVEKDTIWTTSALRAGKKSLSTEYWIIYCPRVTQKDDGIFICQDKYVDEILKKFSFSTVKTTSTSMETSKPLMKDENAEDVDVHLYRSTIGSLMYLTSSRPDIMFVVCAYERFQVTPKVSHPYVVKRIFRYLKGQPKLGLWYPKDLPFDLEAYTDSNYAGASLDRKSTTRGCQFLGSRLILWQCKKQTVVVNSITKAEYVVASNYFGQIDDWNSAARQKVNAAGLKKLEANADFAEIVDFLNASPISYALIVFANMRRKGKDFSGKVTPLFPSMLASQAVEGKGLGQPTEPQHTLTTASPSHADKAVHEERGDSVERAATTVASLDVEQDSGYINRTQSTTIPNTRSERVSTPSYDSPLLGINIPGSDEEIIKLKELMDMCTKLFDRVLDLENGRNSDNTEELNVAEDEHMFDLSDLAGTEVVLEEEPIELVEDKVTTANVNPDDVTLAETLMAIKSTKDKGKGLMQEPEKPVKVKGKDQIEYDADVAQRLQAELDEEAMLEREREEEASNAALIEEWDSIEARIDFDAQLAKRLQAEEREQMSVEEQARLLMKFIAARNKFFSAKRAKEQRNKPPTDKCLITHIFYL
ncbi:hypothetical protein Tco_0313225 [Tanacetum coccineum]